MYLGLFMHNYFARLNEYKILLITNDTQNDTNYTIHYYITRAIHTSN